MAKIYANLIVAGKKVFSLIPEQIKEAVKTVLKEEVGEGRLTHEQYQELVGEAYVG